MKPAVYARVSTDQQTYDQQITACTKYCEIKGWPQPQIYKEIESTRKARPIFNTLLDDARHNKIDTIIVFRLDRAWRSSRQFIMDFDSLQSRGINVISVMEGLDPTTPMGKAMMTIIVALGELERTNISIATKQRLAAKKARGDILGRPKGSKDKKPRKKRGYYLRKYN